MPYIDHVQILYDGFQLARLLVQRVHGRRNELTYDDILDITFRVISLREDRRYRTGESSAEYTEDDIAEALSDHAYDRWRLQGLADRDDAR